MKKTTGLNNKISSFREITPGRVEEFFSKGFKKRHFFPHRIYYLPKPGPDGYKIASRIFGSVDPAAIYEVLLFADNSTSDRFSEDIFFDDDIIWHQQQYGMKGNVAVATILTCNENLFTLTHFSDIYQRISRRRELKTHIEKLYKGWPNMLLNSILNFALEKDLENVFIPTSELALEHTDKKRNPKKELFERVYDLSVNRYYKAEKTNGWWKISINDNREKIILPDKKREVIKKEKTICIVHDIEAGLGHLGIDPGLVDNANRNHKLSLKEMLEVEKKFNIPVTYNIVGCILNEIREQISSDGHCIAFHSYDHNPNENQLLKCRTIDYRIKGYRPPQSKITSELIAENLLYNNFEWFASSAYSLKISEPKLDNGVVTIPIMFDDYSMYADKISYTDWENEVLYAIEKNDFVAFSVHDCYAPYWLPHYESFLNKISGMGKFKTFNQVAEEEFLSYAL
jgi:hypothetical protein